MEGFERFCKALFSTAGASFDEFVRFKCSRVRRLCDSPARTLGFRSGKRRVGTQPLARWLGFSWGVDGFYVSERFCAAEVAGFFGSAWAFDEPGGEGVGSGGAGAASGESAWASFFGDFSLRRSSLETQGRGPFGSFEAILGQFCKFIKSTIQKQTCVAYRG
jgi:hypothetical protein